jgi:hypothetical protein
VTADRRDQKPPLGLRPWFIVAEQRIDEIDAAIARYEVAGWTVPQEWRDERSVIVSSLSRLPS